MIKSLWEGLTMLCTHWLLHALLSTFWMSQSFTGLHFLLTASNYQQKSLTPPKTAQSIMPYMLASISWLGQVRQ